LVAKEAQMGIMKGCREIDEGRNIMTTETGSDDSRRRS